MKPAHAPPLAAPRAVTPAPRLNVHHAPPPPTVVSLTELLKRGVYRKVVFERGRMLLVYRQSEDEDDTNA